MNWDTFGKFCVFSSVASYFVLGVNPVGLVFVAGLLVSLYKLQNEG